MKKKSAKPGPRKITKVGIDHDVEKIVSEYVAQQASLADLKVQEARSEALKKIVKERLAKNTAFLKGDEVFHAQDTKTDLEENEVKLTLAMLDDKSPLKVEDLSKFKVPSIAEIDRQWEAGFRSLCLYLRIQDAGLAMEAIELFHIFATRIARQLYRTQSEPTSFQKGIPYFDSFISGSRWWETVGSPRELSSVVRARQVAVWLIELIESIRIFGTQQKKTLSARKGKIRSTEQATLDKLKSNVKTKLEFSPAHLCMRGKDDVRDSFLNECTDLQPLGAESVERWKKVGQKILSHLTAGKPEKWDFLYPIGHMRRLDYARLWAKTNDPKELELIAAETPESSAGGIRSAIFRAVRDAFHDISGVGQRSTGKKRKLKSRRKSPKGNKL